MTSHPETYLADRAVSVEASIRTRMLGIASELDDLILLGRGDPDFDTVPGVVAPAVKALEDGEHHYTAPAGLLELRQAVASKLERDNQLAYAPEQIIITNGCQEALTIAILALVNPGDEVVLQLPRFNAFDYMVNLAGGRVVDVPTRQEDDFALKADAIHDVLTERTKLLVIANPNNPTGGLTPRADLLEIAELADERELLVVSDEIYEKLLFDSAEHHSLAATTPRIARFCSCEADGSDAMRPNRTGAIIPIATHPSYPRAGSHPLGRSDGRRRHLPAPPRPGLPGLGSSKQDLDFGM